VLLYHRIGVPDARWPLLTVTKARFATQMHALARSTTAVLRIDRLASAMTHRSGVPGDAVALTFDDGLAEQFDAAELLCSLGLPATFFIPTGRIGRHGYLTWDQLRWMVSTRLFEVEAHTVHHVNLTTLPAAAAEMEIVGSRDVIARELGTIPYAFAYPFGAADPTVEALVQRAGFTIAFTDHPNAGTSQYDLGRQEVFDLTAIVGAA
jgi:peptidoglycan/xylan/chitin deacetylase (PgdA/CDA1 family)